MTAKTNFTPVLLKTGEKRRDYIKRRAAAGATRQAILSELNSADLHPGGAAYTMAVVFQVLGADTPRKAAPAPRVVETIDPRLERPVDRPARSDAEVVLSGELTEADREEIREEAIKKVAADARKLAREKLLREEIEKLRGREGQQVADPHENEMVRIRIDLAEYSDRILLNFPQNPPFMHGRDYDVPRHVARTLLEIMARTHQQKAREDGKSDNYYLKKQDNVINGRTGLVSSSMGVTV